MKKNFIIFLITITITLGIVACSDKNEFPDTPFDGKFDYEYVTETGDVVTLTFSISSEPSVEIPGKIYHTSLTKCQAKTNYKIKIPETVEYRGFKYTVWGISPWAFYQDKNLEAVSIPAGVRTIGINKVFSECENLTDVTFADNAQLTFLGLATFSGCKSLKAITIPAGVGSIEFEVFYNCESLARIDFAEGSEVRFIGNHAFAGCKSLTTITLPSNVEKIDANAFSDCDNLKTVILNSNPVIDSLAFPSNTSIVYNNQ